ncbi:MAG: type II toxin-antitoxin system mRNA interferase toxin, RelE/StbE family [Patescibacteria group bacterium]|nr:type II toxin-antitoxin system mRNA interferase toxin, RelE/StbE family [Patescibacteria group bacterium]
MIVKKILYTDKFCSRFKKLPKNIQKIADEKVLIFRKNPIHSSLRLHQLHGKLKGIWSITINKNYRIIFERQENGDIVFISIGRHDIYKYLK